MTVEHRRHVIIPDDLWAQIVARAEAEDRKYSQIIRQAVRQYLANKEAA